MHVNNDQVFTFDLCKQQQIDEWLHVDKAPKCKQSHNSISPDVELNVNI